jgi:hypothetical protein
LDGCCDAFALEMLGERWALSTYGVGSRLHAFRKPYTEYRANVKHRDRLDA